MTQPAYPGPEHQVRDRLLELRQRGVSFPAAWRIAVGTVRFRSGPERETWLAALHATRAEWHASYDRMPSAASAAIMSLGSEMDPLAA